MRNFYIFLFLILAVNTIFSQDEQNPILVKKFNIKRIEGYVDSAMSISEPKLVRIETYNKEGKIVNLETGNFKSMINRFEYLYYNDLVLYEILHYKFDKFIKKTKVLSDIYGVELKSIELDSSGNETAEIIKKDYNRKNQLVSEKQFNKDTLKEHISYEYYKDGLLYKKKYNRYEKMSKEVLFYKYGEKSKQPKSNEKSFLEYYHGLWISTYDHEKDSSLLAEVFYTQDGLIDFVYFYKNNAFHSRLIYKYFTF